MPVFIIVHLFSTYSNKTSYLISFTVYLQRWRRRVIGIISISDLVKNPDGTDIEPLW